MQLEIERKFLIKSDEFKRLSFKKKHIVQGYLNSNHDRVVRIRITDDIGYITVKGASDETGVKRVEWEKEIPLKEAKELINLCEKGIIEKYRYYHRFGDHLFEIDEFLGINKGLCIAEVELKHENEIFQKPSYLGKEVTGEKKYYNSNLTKSPFNEWEKTNDELR